MKQKAFTTFEIFIIIGVIGIFVGMVITAYTVYLDKHDYIITQTQRGPNFPTFNVNEKQHYQGLNVPEYALPPEEQESQVKNKPI